MPKEGSHNTPLYNATQWQRIALVQLLLDHGVDPNIQGRPDSYGEYETALHSVVVFEDEDIAT